MEDAGAAATGAEHIVCDTTVVSMIAVSSSRPEIVAHWPEDARARLDSAVLAITVFVLGEVRSGRIRAGWSSSKIAAAEKAIAAYLLVPVDLEVLSAYVELRSRYASQLGDNDMWIAATAIARGWPLVTCDLDFCRIKSELDLIYLPRKPDSPSVCPEDAD